jgi:calcineurin-like phosphoesterase family protein
MALYKELSNVVEITEGQFFKYGKYHFYLSHYPTLTSNHDIDKPLKSKVINLCGHTHTQDPFLDWDKGLIFHVDADGHNCTPWLLDDIIEKIKNKIEMEKENK